MVVFKTIIGFVKFFVMDLDITDIAVVDLVERIVAHNTKSLNTFARSFNVVLA